MILVAMETLLVANYVFPFYQNVILITWAGAVLIQHQSLIYIFQSQVLEAVGKIAYGGGQTNTQGGINRMRTEQFVTERGDRMSAENVCIVITDGQSTVNPNQTIPEALRAK